MIRFISSILISSLLLLACADNRDSEFSNSQQNDFDELSENKQKWESLNEFNYQMMLQYSAFSLDAGTYDVYVEQETTLAALYENGEYKTSDHYIFELATVARLFEIAEDAIANAEEYDISYDVELGYPININIDYSKNFGGDEVSYIITELSQGSKTFCNDYAQAAIVVKLSLADDLDADVCDADIFIEDGDYFEQLRDCNNNNFGGAEERAGTYSITGSYPGYITQTEDVTVYPFMCHPDLVAVQIELVAED